MSVLQGLTQENSELKQILGVISDEMIEQKKLLQEQSKQIEQLHVELKESKQVLMLQKKNKDSGLSSFQKMKTYDNFIMRLHFCFIEKNYFSSKLNFNLMFIVRIFFQRFLFIW
ncbi:hypothetical protein HFP65_28210 [Bacillus sp. CB62A.1]